MGGLSEAQQAAFTIAAARWEEVLPEPLPLVMVGGETTDGVIIDAEGLNIDGPGQILGSAGPTDLRPGFRGLPARGVMNFDTSDIEMLEAEGTFQSVILHEMGHVLGIGTLWEPFNLLLGAGSEDPRFTGSLATMIYRSLGGRDLTGVPVANTGGQGTRDGHWRESTFVDELMTGFLSGERQPLSELTIAALADLGYAVNLEAADPYVLGEGTEELLARPFCSRGIGRPEVNILDENALIYEV